MPSLPQPYSPTRHQHRYMPEESRLGCVLTSRSTNVKQLTAVDSPVLNNIIHTRHSKSANMPRLHTKSISAKRNRQSPPSSSQLGRRRASPRNTPMSLLRQQIRDYHLSISIEFVKLCHQLDTEHMIYNTQLLS